MINPQPDALVYQRRLLHSKPALIIILTALLLAVAAVADRSVKRYHDAFGMYHDDALYMVTAQSLAEGHGYRIASLPGQPLESKYPIGFPLLLSGVWKLMPAFPENLLTVEILQFLIGAASIVVAAAYMIATRKVTPLLGAVIFAASLLNLHYLDFMPMVMSELPCALLSYAALWLVEYRSQKPFTISGAIGLGLLLAAIALVRLFGAAPVIATGIFLALNRQWRLLCWSGGTAAIIIVPYLVWQLVSQSASPAYLSYYTSYLGHTTGTLPGNYLSLWCESFQYSWQLQMQTYLPFLSALPYQSLSPSAFWLIYRVGFLLLELPLVAGFIVTARKGSLIGICGLVIAAMLCIWPAKVEWRFILPWLPLSYFLYFAGLRWLCWMLKGRVRARGVYRRLSALSAVGMALYLVAGSVWEASARAGKYGETLAARLPELAPAIQAADYQEACAWIRDHTNRSDVFVCNNDPLLYLYTGRQAVGPSRFELSRFATGDLVDPGSMTDAIRFSRARWVMIEPSYRALGHFWAQSAASVVQLSESHHGCLRPVFRSSHSLIYVFGVNPSRLPPAP